jgi:hypothetical protein
MKRTQGLGLHMYPNGETALSRRKMPLGAKVDDEGTYTEPTFKKPDLSPVEVLALALALQVETEKDK